MPYLIIAKDHPGKEAERESIREAHRRHLASAGKKLLASGALLSEDGKATEDEEEARQFEADDPYAKAGIRAEVNIIRWRLRWWRGLFSADGFPEY